MSVPSRVRAGRTRSRAKPMTASSTTTPYGTRRRRNERPLVLAVLLIVLTALAWAALWVWSASPYGRYVAHDRWGEFPHL